MVRKEIGSNFIKLEKTTHVHKTHGRVKRQGGARQRPPPRAHTDTPSSPSFPVGFDLAQVLINAVEIISTNYVCCIVSKDYSTVCRQ